MKAHTLAAVAICCTALSGCAAHIVEASEVACTSFGFSPGTDAFSQCVHQEVAMRDDAVNRAPLSAKGGVQGPASPSALAVGGFTPGVPVLKHSYASDTNRVCVYNQAGNEVTVAIKLEAACPQMLQ